MRSIHAVRLSCALLLIAVCFSGCTSAPMTQGVTYQTASPVRTDAASPAAPTQVRVALAEARHAASPTAQATAGATPVPAHNRQIVYTGSVTLTTPDAPDAMQRINRVASSLGGFLHKWESDTITIRVPVARFHDAIDQIAELGSLSNKQIDALDLSDQLRDLDARIATAESMRKRLVALLERSGKMEELLKVEQELQRVMEHLERLKAARLAMQDSASFSTLTVRVVEAQPVRRPTFASSMPFSWINHVGTELRSGRSFSRADRKFGKGVKVTLPDGFVRFWQEDYTTVAMSSRQVRVKIQRHKNFDQAKPAFWADLLEDHLAQGSLIKAQGREDLKTKDGDAVVLVSGSKAFGQGDFGYLVAVATAADYVYTYEAWGPLANFTAAKLALEDSIETMRVSSGW